MFFVSPEGGILMANQAWRETLGFRETDLPELTLFDVTDQADHAACQAWLQDPPPPEVAGRIRLRFRARGGRQVLAEGAVAGRVEDGRIIYLHAIFQDKTAEYRDLALLREQAELLRSLTTRAPVGVFRTDLEGRLTYSNERWRHFAGLAHVEEPRGVWWQMVHPDDRAGVIALWQRAQRLHGEFVSEFRVRGAGTALRWCRVRLTPAGSASDHTACWVGLAEDSTIARAASQKLRTAKEELEAAVVARTRELRATNQELDEFAYALTHDMKAPLRGIHRLTEWLVHDYAPQLGAEGLRLCGMLQERVRFLNEFVQGVLSYTRVGRERVAEVDVPLGPLLARIRDVLSPPPVIEWIVPESAPVIRGVPEYLHQIFQNLLDNAIRHLDRPGGRIEVRWCRRETGWEFTVADNGPGIPRRYHDKLFQAFQKLPSATGSPGTGIGLALVKRIVETRGGEVRLESEEGQGTTVRFFWPHQSSAQFDPSSEAD